MDNYIFSKYLQITLSQNRCRISIFYYASRIWWKQITMSGEIKNVTWNAVVSTSLHVEWHEVFAKIVRRSLWKQMTWDLLGDELITSLCAVSYHSQHHHVHPLVRLLVHYVRTTELLYRKNYRTPDHGNLDTIIMAWRALSASGRTLPPPKVVRCLMPPLSPLFCRPFSAPSQIAAWGVRPLAMPLTQWRKYGIKWTLNTEFI